MTSGSQQGLHTKLKFSAAVLAAHISVALLPRPRSISPTLAEGFKLSISRHSAPNGCVVANGNGSRAELGPYLDALGSGNSFSFTPGQAISYFGFSWANATGGILTATAYNSLGAQIDAMSAGVSGYQVSDVNRNEFAGIYRSTADIARIEISGSDVVMTDVVWAQAVPEPAEYALMGLGLAFVGAMARRRNNK